RSDWISYLLRGGFFMRTASRVSKATRICAERDEDAVEQQKENRLHCNESTAAAAPGDTPISSEEAVANDDLEGSTIAATALGGMALEKDPRKRQVREHLTVVFHYSLDERTFALVQWEGDVKHSEILEALTAALTEWVDTTDDGKAAWQGSHLKFNVGDLCEW